jgi:hypothetical protein
MKFSVHLFHFNPQDSREVGFVEADSILQASVILGLNIDPKISSCPSMISTDGRRFFVDFREQRKGLTCPDDLRLAADKEMSGC